MIGRRFILAGLFLLFAASSAWATHLRAGEITIRRVNCTSLTFVITITVYTNTGSDIRFGDGVLDFGDGSDPLITPTIENTYKPELGENVGLVTFSTEHTYAGPGQYIISYLEPNRNAGILNMFNSVETRFYLESKINIDPFLGCDNSPRLLVPPIDKACTGAAWYHNPGAYDPDGDSLSYEMTIPKRDKGLEVNNYRPPNTKEFYDRIGLDYAHANENGTGPPTFDINPVTGTIIWDAPGAPGEYNIAFVIKQWRKVSGVWINQGYVVRDMQIIVEDCNNKRPELVVPPDICVNAGDQVKADIFGTDPDNDSVKIEVFSQLLTIQPNPATYAPFPVIYQKTSASIQAKLTFTWNTACLNVKDQPYQVVFKITDKPANGPALVQFKTWNIKVVGPAPKWKDITLLPAQRRAKLEWKPYATPNGCSNAEIMQVWRRVDSEPYVEVPCVTGMPDYLGFKKIAEVPITTSVYTDTNGGKGLAPGARYCYRLVAAYPLPGGGLSYVSRDTCLAPIKADAPVITHVTVDKTHSVNGQITVSWRSPFDIDKLQFPPPYTYKVFRAEGFTGNGNILSPHTGTIPDTTFVDTDINTEERTFNYKIVLYDNTNQPIDTSAEASSVRLELKPEFQRIVLNWAANVPWTNASQKFPRHLIYRGPEGATESQLTLIDSINVTSGRFTYVDSGQWNSTPLDNELVYCYRVKTKGTYGNPKIKEPQYNFSQINCAQPNDNNPPCKQTIEVVAQKCDQYFMSEPCDPKVFSNTLTWKRPTDPQCRADIRSYKVYVASNVGAPFEMYAENVRDTFFIDSNLPSFARCYKISAVDRAGNESELSEQFCFDNCPNYELPNVFTPNGDNCNEKFSAFSARQVVDENGNGPCGPVDPVQQKLKCARFVEKVVLVVLNRWGKEVYHYESGSENSIYIDWDGRDNNGNELPAAVYYYNATVTFNVVDPDKKNREIRGWVQLIR